MKAAPPFLVFMGLLFTSRLAAAKELEIEVTLPVECDRKTKKGDDLSIHYSGTLESSGEKFDSSYDRNQPLTFRLGAGQVIQGWDQGLLDMCIGERRTLKIPPELGYGLRAIGPIPANSVLIFRTELVAIAGRRLRRSRGRQNHDNGHRRHPGSRGAVIETCGTRAAAPLRGQI
ncbi:hypothetical protein XA68_11283 [Ophiocordyceps unilateralis]|uniref:peptidylprolyl isomerase n=1 Tax=Ophiocordyceps unilateralis TaxID=268505 RepID=A0A2A9P282_OPHUN|nr:hypothetical protein XA68_11283 [Ophiocordyceps unilateralis]